MYDIFTRTHFSSGHHLRNYPGNCERPHGHNWKVEVTVRATELDELGMGIDFKNLKKAVNVIMEELDHRDLNELPAFQKKNPSSENIAAYIFDRLRESLTCERYRPYSVTVCETDNCCVTYREG